MTYRQAGCRQRYVCHLRSGILRLGTERAWRRTVPDACSASLNHPALSTTERLDAYTPRASVSWPSHPFSILWRTYLLIFSFVAYASGDAVWLDSSAHLRPLRVFCPGFSPLRCSRVPWLGLPQFCEDSSLWIILLSALFVLLHAFDKGSSILSVSVQTDHFVRPD